MLRIGLFRFAPPASPALGHELGPSEATTVFAEATPDMRAGGQVAMTLKEKAGSIRIYLLALF
jgi:hypothetical protein